MSNYTLSENERDYFAQMEAHDREIEAACRADLDQRIPDIRNLRPFTQAKVPETMPEHVNCRCTIVWPQEAAEEALNHG